jgi:hypothetical protein
MRGTVTLIHSPAQVLAALSARAAQAELAALQAPDAEKPIAFAVMKEAQACLTLAETFLPRLPTKASTNGNGNGGELSESYQRFAGMKVVRDEKHPKKRGRPKKATAEAPRPLLPCRKGCGRKKIRGAGPRGNHERTCKGKKHAEASA